MTAVNLAGYHLTFDMEMTYASDMQFLNNTFNNGDRTIYVGNELEYYQSYDPSSPTNPFSFQNGALVITASPNPQGGLPYTSGLLTTGLSHDQSQGYFEVRMAMPSNAGFWPTFWMLAAGPTNYFTEIDIAEEPNNQGIGTYFTSIKDLPYANTGVFNTSGLDLTAYHTYGLLWTASTMQLTFDGQLFGTAIQTPSNLVNQQMYMLLNLAVGGWAGNPATGATAQMKVDYLRAYSNDPSVEGWSQQPVSSPDGVDTTPNYGLEPNYYEQSLSGSNNTGGTNTASTNTTGTITTGTITTGTTTNPATLPLTVVLGSGPDMLALQVNEDAYQGDAQFTISVDGKQVGGTQTVTALKSSGSTQAFDVLGSFGAGTHTATVNFLNDLYGGSATADRNLYVTQASIDNTAISSSTLTEDNPGAQTFSFRSTSTAVSSAPTPSIFTLHLAEDAYRGDAQFIVTIDGNKLAPAQSVSALNTSGASQAFSFSDVLGAGTHDVGVQFTNDLWGGSSTTDRNLYVTGADLNATAQSSSVWTAALYVNGTTHFNLTVPS